MWCTSTRSCRRGASLWPQEQSQTHCSPPRITVPLWGTLPGPKRVPALVSTLSYEQPAPLVTCTDNTMLFPVLLLLATLSHASLLDWAELSNVSSPETARHELESLIEPNTVEPAAVISPDSLPVLTYRCGVFTQICANIIVSGYAGYMDMLLIAAPSHYGRQSSRQTEWRPKEMGALALPFTTNRIRVLPMPEEVLPAAQVYLIAAKTTIFATRCVLVC